MKNYSIQEQLENYLSSNELWNIFDEMKEIMTSEELLENLAKAMGDDELESNLEYIARMWDL